MGENHSERIRRRATAIVMQEDRILLLREPHDSYFHIPGGDVNQSELPIAAVARELHEETSLTATKIEYAFSYREDWADSRHYTGQIHSVFKVEAEGKIRLGPEIQEYVWWDCITKLPLIEYVKPMLGML